MRLSTKLCTRALAFLVLANSGASQPPRQPGINPIFSRVPFWESKGLPAKLLETNFVFYDVAAGQYVVSYPAMMSSKDSSDTRRLEFRLNLQSTVEPQVAASMVLGQNGVYTYKYTIANGAEARTSIRRFSLVVAPEDEEITLAENAGWSTLKDDLPRPAIVREGGPELRIRANAGRIVSWQSHPMSDGIATTRNKSGFSLQSRFLPGLIVAYASNDARWVLPPDLPAEVSAQLALVSGPDANWRTTVTIGPKFNPNDGPTKDPVWIANDYRAAMERLRASGFLARDSKFCDEIDSLLQTVTVIGQRVPLEVRTPPASSLEAEIFAALVQAMGRP